MIRRPVEKLLEDTLAELEGGHARLLEIERRHRPLLERLQQKLLAAAWKSAASGVCLFFASGIILAFQLAIGLGRNVEFVIVLSVMSVFLSVLLLAFLCLVFIIKSLRMDVILANAWSRILFGPALKPDPRAKAQFALITQQLRGGRRFTRRVSAWAAGPVAGTAVAFVVLAIVLVLPPRARPLWVASPVASVPKAPVVSSEERILKDVTDVLRLQGIAADITYSADGTVTVTGHLGDPHALEQAIRSRAMQEIAGLKRVVAVNLDHSGTTTGTSADSARIVSAISGKESFVVTADGSRYYAGSTLPKGGKLVGVDGDEILIERDGKTERVKLGDLEAGSAEISAGAKRP